MKELLKNGYPLLVSESGDVYKTTHRYNRIHKTVTPLKLKQRDNGKGYKRISLGRVSVYVHRLVAEAYILNPNNYPEVNHINGIKTDNRVENLEWCTCQMNINHAVKLRLVQNKFKKLNANSVIEIRKLSSNGATQNHLSRVFGVCPKTIKQILNREIHKTI